MTDDIIVRLRAALAGRYEIERQIGAGGMATVYLARDLKHKRRVAVKVLRPELADLLGAERFLKEIEVTANLQHPNILPLYDSGEADGSLYYVTPFIEGESLRAVLKREGQLSLEQALKVAGAVAAALQFAHERGVVHRDIKPENILLQAGQAMVADFGIALAFSEAEGERLTETGISIGTPSYMSPEQAAGSHDLDGRSDVYALGAVLYEMLVGEPPFSGDSAQAVLVRVLTEDRPSVRSTRPSVPPDVDAAIRKALAKEPGERFESAEEFSRTLDAAAGAGRTTAPMSRGTRRAIVGVAALTALTIGFLGYRLYRDSAQRRWVNEVAIPEIERLMGEARFADAYRLVTEAQAYAPDHPQVRSYLDASTVPVDVITDPPGARVWFRGYSATDGIWYDAGVSPVEQALFPTGYVRVRLETAGHQPLELGFVPNFGALYARLVPENDASQMVWVPAGTYSFSEQPVPIDSFRIDRHEVTNAEFQAFVDAGGYARPEYWPGPFVRDGRRLTREQALARFVDATGRPGPAGWELSRYPDGREAYPVGGLSWYEAAAYCTFAGKSLPTYYHWMHAAGLEVGVWDDILAFSNFGGEDLVPTESLGSVGPYGTHDMPGNVREWVWNQLGDLRYILGGAWTDPEYLYADGDAFDPWSREPGNGLRCAVYESQPEPNLFEPIAAPFFDFNNVEPVDDATFEIYRSFYEYQPADLDARIVSSDTAEHWVKQKVDFTAAYADERVSAYVFLPRNAEPPYQSVIYFPGVTAFRVRSSENLAEFAMVGFIPRSGRALVYPIYKGSYERYIEDPRPGPVGSRQQMVWRTQDLQRTVDYITEREDLRNDAIGYLGLSLGAEIAVPVALEKRLKALVLVGGAFDPAWRGVLPPEARPWNFASRITTPTILINGRRDFMHPYEAGQVPYFEAFDVPETDKKFIVLDSGHIPHWNDVIRHSLDWYDRYLGPVR